MPCRNLHAVTRSAKVGVIMKKGDTSQGAYIHRSLGFLPGLPVVKTAAVGPSSAPMRPHTQAVDLGGESPHTRTVRDTTTLPFTARPRAQNRVSAVPLQHSAPNGPERGALRLGLEAVEAAT